VVLALTGHGLRAFRRNPVAAFFTLGLPVVFLVFIAGLFGDAVVESRGGLPLARFFTPALAVFGAVQAAFCLLAADTARLRENGVFQRLRATPVPPVALLAGRIASSAVVAVVAAALVFAVGAAFYGARIDATALAAVALSLAVGVASFAALGLAVAALVRGATAVLALTNGLLVSLAFVSDVFVVAAAMPAWLDRIGWVFPLRHLAAAVVGAANGSGVALDHLAVVAAWGLAGGLVAVRWFAWEPRAAGRVARPRPAAEPATGPIHAVPVPHAGRRPSPVDLLRTQVWYALLALRRDGSAVFFALLFPVLLLALFPAISGGSDPSAAAGQMLPAMMTYGLAVTAFSVMPSTVAEARERRALARLAATPMPLWSYVAGRVVAAYLATGATAVALVAVAVAGYGVRLDMARLPAAVVAFTAGVACFATLGFAVLALVRRAQAVVALTLGLLLSLSFISDVFVIGAALPRPLALLGDVLPLKHTAHALTAALEPGLAGAGFAGWDLAVVAAWTVAGAVVARRMTWSET
jgi:ABC-type multidrug transport system permease subunit